MTARYSYTPLYGYNKGVRGIKPPARIIGWDVRDNDTPWSEPASLIVTVTARSEARAIVSRLNKQQRELRKLSHQRDVAVRVAAKHVRNAQNVVDVRDRW